MEILLFIGFIILAYVISGLGKKIKDSHSNLTDIAGQINQTLSNIKYSFDNDRTKDNNEFLRDFINMPSDKMEFENKKNSLVKCYATYLMHENDLSKEDGLFQAQFEVDKFGIKHVMDEIKWEDAFKVPETENSFIKTNLFKRQIEQFWTIGLKGKKYIDPRELFRPVYGFLKKENYKDGEIVIINPYGDNDHYGYIRNRAIIYNLQKLGVIQLVENTGSDIFSSINSPFIFVSDNTDVIKQNINNGYKDFAYPLSEDNAEFDEWLSEHEYSTLFRKRY